MEFSIRISGATPVIKELGRGADRNAVIEAIAEGVIKGGDRVIENVKRNAPMKTGHLRASYGKFTPELIKARYSPEREHPEGYNRPIRRVLIRGNRVELEIGSSVPYAEIEETRGYVKAGSQGRSPYQRPALIEETPKILADIKDAFEKWVERAQRARRRRG